MEMNYIQKGSNNPKMNDYNDSQYEKQDISSFYFEARVVGKLTGAQAGAIFLIEGLITRGSGNTASVEWVSPITKFISAAMAGASATVATDTTNNDLQITVTAGNATSTRWSAKLDLIEVSY